MLLKGLRRLEYRGYDSAGIATIANGQSTFAERSESSTTWSRLSARGRWPAVPGSGTHGATHGRPSEQNAHPHRAGDVVVIHNGIIENYVSLREELAAAGRQILSETDTEIISHLIENELSGGADLLTATRTAIKRLEGSYAIVVMSSREPDCLIAAKNSTPVVLGVGDGENFVASDIPALLDYTRPVTLDPIHRLLQPLWLKPARAPLRIDVHRNKPGPL